MLKKFNLLLIIFMSFAGLLKSEASPTADQAKAMAAQLLPASKPADAPVPVIEGFSGNFGVAVIEQIRNSTSSYCDLFLRKELGSLQGEIPTGSVIKLKTIDPYFAPDPNDSRADPYLYYKVQRLAGTYRLVASTKDPKDPDTEFIVEHMRDEKLDDWILLRPVAQDKLYVIAKKGQEVAAKEIDINSKIDYTSEKSPHLAHWKILGSSFANCYLKSRSQENGLLSCRDLSDQKKIEPFGYQPLKLEKGNKLVANPITVFGWETYEAEQQESPGFWTIFRRPRPMVGQVTIDGLSASGISSLAAQKGFNALLRLAYKGLTTTLYNFNVFAWTKDLFQRYPTGDLRYKDKPQNLDFCNPQDFKMENAILLSRVSALMPGSVINDNNTNGWNDNNITISPADSERVCKTFAPEFGVFSQALLDAATRESAFEKTITYGDVIRLANIKTCLHLHANTDQKNVCLASEYNNDFNSTFPRKLNLDESGFVHPYSYFIIKGPHFGDDSMNAEVGQPVKNGDKIRLESVLYNKNLTCSKRSASAGEDDLVVPGLAGKDGVGTNYDNFIISFVQADGSKARESLCYGQVLKLTHQNTGALLCFDMVAPQGYNPASTPLGIGTTLKSGVNALWAVDFCQKAQLPVKRVAWTGVPYGAPSTEVTNKETLTVEIVKKGMGGGIAQNATLNFGAIRLDAQDPLVTGFTKESIDGFSPGMQITLNPLSSKGVGWVSTSFERENKAGVTFLVRAMDSGNAEIVLGRDMSLDFVYKLVLGAKNNNSAVLYRRTFDPSGKPLETPVLEVDKTLSPYAALRSGLFSPYWVSVNNGIIMAGMGQKIGENIIIAYKEPLDQATVSRIGFGCNRDKIDITEVNLVLPLDIGQPNVLFANNPGTVSLGADSSPTTLQKLLARQEETSLRVPGRASLGFDIKIGSNVKISLIKKDGASKKTNYTITLNTSLDAQKDLLKSKNWEAAKAFIKKLDFYAKEVLSPAQVVPSSPITSANIHDLCSKIVAGLKQDLPAEVFVDKNVSTATIVTVENFIDKFSKAVDQITNMTYGDIVDVVSKINDQSIQGFSDLVGPGGLISSVAKDLGLGNYGNTQTLKAGLVSLIFQIFNNIYFNLFKRSCLIIQKSTGGSSFKTIKVVDDSCIDGFEKLPDDQTKMRVWFNFIDGKFFVGTGEFGKNVFCYAQDFQVGSTPDSPDNFNQIELVGSGASVSNITLGSELEIANLKEDATYDLNQKIFNYKGSFQIISPYRYRLFQEKEQVFFKDEISGITYIPGKVPQRGAIYRFMLTLTDNTPPLLDWRTEPENPQMLDLAKRASILRSTGDSLMQAAQMVQGSGNLGGMLGLVASAAFAGGGVASQNAAAGLEANLKDYKDVNAQVFTDQTKLNQLISSSIPQEAQANKENFEKELAVGGNWIGDASKLGLLIPHFLKCLSRITHPYVIDNQSNKDLLISYIGSLYKTHEITYSDPAQKVDNTFYDMVKLLMNAYNNRYLTDTSKTDDLKVKKDWYLKANAIFSRILKTLSKTKDDVSISYNEPIELPGMSGEYVWLDKVLSNPGRCLISFNAKGLNDVLVCFAKDRKSLRNSNDQVYEICFGARNNTCGEIRTASLTKPAFSTKNPLALCQEVDIQTPYWINIKDGIVELGRGPVATLYKNTTALNDLLNQTLESVSEADQAGAFNVNVIFSEIGELKKVNQNFRSTSKSICKWKDPFPISDFQYIGLSAWDSPVTFNNVSIDDDKDSLNFVDKINTALKNSILQIVDRAKGMVAQNPDILQSQLRDIPNFPAVVFDKFASRVEFVDVASPVKLTKKAPLDPIISPVIQGQASSYFVSEQASQMSVEDVKPNQQQGLQIPQMAQVKDSKSAVVQPQILQQPIQANAQVVQQNFSSGPVQVIKQAFNKVVGAFSPPVAQPDVQKIQAQALPQGQNYVSAPVQARKVTASSF